MLQLIRSNNERKYGENADLRNRYRSSWNMNAEYRHREADSLPGYRRQCGILLVPGVKIIIWWCVEIDYQYKILLYYGVTHV